MGKDVVLMVDSGSILLGIVVLICVMGFFAVIMVFLEALFIKLFGAFKASWKLVREGL